MATKFEDTELAEFQVALLGWYAKSRRKFPWRRRSSPYAILLAEKLLQQTAAKEHVVQAYLALLNLYPTPRHLALASVTDLEEIVAPLGFRYRAKELRVLGNELMIKHGGEIPRSLGDLLSLPGIGDYSARAVLSFSYREDVAVVDTNVARFLFRVFNLAGKMPSNPARKKGLIDLAMSLVPSGRSREWNFAILDLCALVCTPATPACDKCPILRFCSFGSLQSTNGPDLNLE